MALAATKVWAFTSLLYPYLNSTQQMGRNLHFGFKEILKTMGWTVEGGYTPANGLHNNDQVDVTQQQAPETSDLVTSGCI